MNEIIRSDVTIVARKINYISHVQEMGEKSMGGAAEITDVFIVFINVPDIKYDGIPNYNIMRTPVISLVPYTRDSVYFSS